MFNKDSLPKVEKLSINVPISVIATEVVSGGVIAYLNNDEQIVVDEERNVVERYDEQTRLVAEVPLAELTGAENYYGLFRRALLHFYSN